MKKTAIILSSIILAFFYTSCSKDDIENITEQEKEDLTVLREEEKLARDVYLYAYDKYELTIFNNIASSEQTHMDKVLEILEMYNISDPAKSDKGVFTNHELQTLYNTLTTTVDSSLVHALTVGATIEDLDIKDIDIFIKNSQNETILDMYKILSCGSTNHMRGFYKQLQENGAGYTPQYISEEQFNSIINASHTSCGN